MSDNNYTMDLQKTQALFASYLVLHKNRASSQAYSTIRKNTCYVLTIDFFLTLL
jgi:hypothetical protein